jgi:uncharacterized protein (TIGR00297 family)
MLISLLRVLVFAACFMLFYYAMSRKAIDKLGFVSAAIIGMMLLAILPLVMWFSLMVALFIAGSITAKYRRPYKLSLGVAERARGRSVFNVIANGGVALIAAVLFYITQNDIFIFAYACSIASACADTIATELGQLSGKKPLLISTLKPVKTGTTGAVSLLGETMALGGALGIAAIPFLYFGVLGFWNFRMLFIITASGFLGCQIDSLIGAFLEYPSKKKRGSVLFNNHTTNFISALAAALIGMALYVLL